MREKKIESWQKDKKYIHMTGKNTQFFGSFLPCSTVVIKSRIRETLNFSTDADSITIAMKGKKI